MGNKICSSTRNMVEERFTRPQRLIRQPSYVDFKKLRKLILNEKLAPCFDGIEDISDDLEECPICFFFYPSLNRSRCCMKGICTECFLQMKPSPVTQLTQCPFCKCSSYTVEYRGARTKEEKCIEQAEDQKVMEAKIRMRSEEFRSSDQANRNLSVMEVEPPASTSLEVSNTGGGVQELGAFNLLLAAGHVDASESSVLNAWNERNTEFGVDLEEVMMMEAIWRSIQDAASHKCAPKQSSGSNGICRSQIENHLPYEIISSSTLIDPPPDCLPSDSASGGNGIAIAVARNAERNILQSGTFHSIREISQTQDEISMGEHDQAGPFESSEDPDFNDARSGEECLSISSTSGDDSWDSFAATFHDTSQHSDGDEDPVMELFDTDSCGSSVHTISDVSANQSPSDFNNYESFCGSIRPGPIGSQAEFGSLDYSNS